MQKVCSEEIRLLFFMQIKASPAARTRARPVEIRTVEPKARARCIVVNPWKPLLRICVGPVKIDVAIQYACNVVELEESVRSFLVVTCWSLERKCRNWIHSLNSSEFLPS